MSDTDTDTDTDLPAPTDTDRIAQLEQTVASLTAQLEVLTSATTNAPDTSDEPSPTPTDEGGTSVVPTRRNLFRLAAGAAAAGGAIAVAGSTPAAAADNQSVLIGNTRTQGDTGRTSTIVDYQNTNGPQKLVGGIANQDANIFLVRDRTSGLVIINQLNVSAYPAAVAGYAYRAVSHGVYGFSGVGGGYGVVGSGSADSTGVLARGGQANLKLENEGDAPTARTDAHSRGEVVSDSEGRLWYCTVAGSPGTWQLLATAGAVGAFTAIAAARVFDSRFSTNFPAGSNRTVSIKDQINVDSGVVTTTDIVPAGAKAITANITITNTVGGGFVAVNPGGDAVVKASTVNWSASGQTAANAGVFALNSNREVEVIAGGPAGSSTDALIDVTGYYL